MSTHPVIGRLTPWDGGIKPTCFSQFTTPEIHGLARIAPDGGVEIMAIASKAPGMGFCRQFLNDLMKAYPRVRFWSVINVRLLRALERRGFQEFDDMDEYGEMTDCMEWRNEP